MLFSRARSAKRDGGGCHCLASGRLPGNVTGCTHRRSLPTQETALSTRHDKITCHARSCPLGPKVPASLPQIVLRNKANI